MINKTDEKLPSGWSCTTLNDVTVHYSGDSKLIKGKLSNEPLSGFYPAYSATGQDVWRDTFKEEGDAVIVSAVGARCGKSFLTSGKWSAIANTHVVRAIDSALNTRLLWYLINNEHFWIRSGAAQPFIKVGNTFNKEFHLPPFPEQKRIVTKLEELFSELEASIANLKRVQANLKRYRASVLKAACEGKLVPTEAELARKENRSYETGEQLLQRILSDRRKNWHGRGKYKEPAISNASKIGLLTEGWVYASVEQLAKRVQYGSSAKTNEDERGVPVLRMGNIQDGTFDLDKLKYLPKSHDEFPELLLKSGDLLFNRTNSAELVGKSAVFKGTPSPCSFASYLIRVQFGDGCIPDYVCYFINSVFGRAWISSVVSQQVGQANVNGTKLQALVIPLPPYPEQARIVAEVERRFSVVEELESVVTANLQRSIRFRQSILQKAFDGDLVVQDPNDESASVLLERIRAKREADRVENVTKKAAKIIRRPRLKRK